MHIFKSIFEILKCIKMSRKFLAFFRFEDEFLKKNFKKIKKSKKEMFTNNLCSIHGDLREIARVDGMSRLLDMWVIVEYDDNVKILSKNLIHLFKGYQTKYSFPIKELEYVKSIQEKFPFIFYSGPGSDLRYSHVLLDMSKEASLLICLDKNRL